MATIIFTGRLTDDVRILENKNVVFTIAENVSKDQTNYFDCIGKFSEKQVDILKKGKLVEIVGEYNMKVNEKDGKRYYNNSTWVHKLNFPYIQKVEEK